MAGDDSWTRSRAISHEAAGSPSFPAPAGFNSTMIEEAAEWQSAVVQDFPPQATPGWGGRGGAGSGGRRVKQRTLPMICTPAPFPFYQLVRNKDCLARLSHAVGTVEIASCFLCPRAGRSLYIPGLPGPACLLPYSDGPALFPTGERGNKNPNPTTPHRSQRTRSALLCLFPPLHTNKTSMLKPRRSPPPLAGNALSEAGD